MRSSCTIKRKGFSTFLITGLVGLFLICHGCTAHAQKSPKPTNSKIQNPVKPDNQIAQKPSNKTQETPQSGTQPPSGWETTCTSSGRGTNPDCKIEQTIVVTKTQQRILSVLVRVPAESHTPAMMIHLPLGLFLPAGITLQLDQQMSLQLNVQTCDANGCYSGTPISENMLTAMKTGKHLTVSFQSLAKQTMSVPVPLVGFAEAYQKVR